MKFGMSIWGGGGEWDGFEITVQYIFLSVSVYMSL